MRFAHSLFAIAAAIALPVLSVALLLGGHTGEGVTLGAFSLAQLTPLAYGNGFTLWHYRTADAAATVDSAAYFNLAVKFLRVGDIIERVTFTDTTWAAVSTYGRHIVLSNDGTDVDVTDSMVGLMTDTD